MLSAGRASGALALSVCAAAVMAAPAAAAPVKSPRSDEPFEFRCPGGIVAVVPAPGKGHWTPGFIVGTHRVAVPYRFTFAMRAGDEIVTETVSKKARIPAGAITCIATQTFVVDGVTFANTFGVTVALRGKPGASLGG